MSILAYRLALLSQLAEDHRRKGLYREAQEYIASSFWLASYLIMPGCGRTRQFKRK